MARKSTRRAVAGFRGLIERVGAKEAGKRLGVTARTIRDWDRRGVPERRARAAGAAASRSEKAARAAQFSKAYRQRGWKRLRGFSEVDKAIGAERGHSLERWRLRKEWWEEHRPDEELAKKVSLIRTSDGRVLYVNGDLIFWRAYTVDGRLFWTQSTYLEGYATAAEFKRRYPGLDGHDVRISFT